MLASLDNQVVFKHAFTDKEVFERLIKDFYDLDIKIGKIETEKKFQVKSTQIDITLDIYAETNDNRFVIEIQKIQYDHNFDRFLHYFISLLIEQQTSYKNYKFKKTVLGIVVLTRPYRFHKLTGEPILDNYMKIDFNPRDINDKIIAINSHELKFINTDPKYKSAEQLPQAIQDWIDLFQTTIYDGVNIKLNFENKAIKKVTRLIEIDNIPSDILDKMRKESGAKEVLVLEHKAGVAEGIEQGIKQGIEQEKANSKKLIEQAKEEKNRAEVKAKIYKLLFENKSKEEIIEILKISSSDIDELLNGN